MAKKKDKKRGKILKVILFLVLLGLIFYVIPCYLLDVRINNIYVKNNNVITDQEIIEMAHLEDYPNFYKTSASSIRKSVESSPFIKSCKVKKRLFNKVIIEVEEYKVLFIRLDTKKIVFENKSEIDYDEEILDVPYLINYVKDTKYDTLVKKLNKIDDDVLEKISEIKYDPNKYDEDRFILYMDDDNYVYVTLPKFDVLNKYNEAVTKLEGKKGTLYLDSGNYFEIRK